MPEKTNPYVRSERIGDAIVFSVLVPRLQDPEASYALRDEMLSELAHAPTDKIVIDLERVTFIGSVGFLAFLNARRQVPRGRMVLCHVSPLVQQALKVCRLVAEDGDSGGAFELQPTREAAVASLGS